MAHGGYGLLTIADGEAESGYRPGDEPLAERPQTLKACATPRSQSSPLVPSFPGLDPFVIHTYD